MGRLDRGRLGNLVAGRGECSWDSLVRLGNLADNKVVADSQEHYLGNWDHGHLDNLVAGRVVCSLVAGGIPVHYLGNLARDRSGNNSSLFARCCKQRDCNS